MRGLMQDYPLTLSHLLYRAERLFPRKVVASREPAGMLRYTYAGICRRVRQLANVLQQLDIHAGDRVRVLRRAPFGGPLMIDNRGTRVAVSKQLAEKIRVEVLP